MSRLFASGGQSFSFSISPSSEYSGLISLKIGWFDILAVQGTSRSLLQHHSAKASILWHSAFFMVQPLQPYVTAGKTIALMNLGQWSNASAFQHTVYVCHCFPAKKQSSSDFMGIDMYTHIYAYMYYIIRVY